VVVLLVEKERLLLGTHLEQGTAAQQEPQNHQQEELAVAVQRS
jgi:hypothetical protein